MKPKQKRLLAFFLGAILAIGLVAGILYVRQRLFTENEPIVLAP